MVLLRGGEIPLLLRTFRDQNIRNRIRLHPVLLGNPNRGGKVLVDTGRIFRKQTGHVFVEHAHGLKVLVAVPFSQLLA